MQPGRLIRAARRLTAALGEGTGLAGGLAVAAWGEIRATRDVDIVTMRPLADVEERLHREGISFSTRLGDPLGNDLPWVVEGELEGAHFQVFAPRGGRAFATVNVSPAGDEGAAVPVVALTDLVRLKLEAGESKDLWDVSRLVRRHPGQRQGAMAVASTLGLEAELTRWLEREH